MLKVVKKRAKSLFTPSYTEVTSPGEIFLSLKAGFEPEKILYNNIAKSGLLMNLEFITCQG